MHLQIHSARVDATKHNQNCPPPYRLEHLIDRHTQTNTVQARMLTAALKIKTNQCLMLQILGVRKEGSGRIERERKRKGRGD